MNLRRFFLPMLALMAALVVLSQVVAFAQDGQPPAPAPDPGFGLAGVLNIVLGAAVALIIKYAKKFPFVDNNPKVVAMVLSLLISLATTLFSGKAGAAAFAGTLVISMLTQLSAAVTTHEVALKPLARSE